MDHGPDKTSAFLAGLLDKEAGPFSLEGEAPAKPTDAQKAAGNYAKDHIRFAGLDISIENRAGTMCSGVDKSGRRWSTRMPWHYGYVKGSKASDGDHVDAFLNPDSASPYMSYIIRQVDPSTRRFDEFKCMLGWKTKAEAIDAYHQAYEKGWRGFGGCVSMSLPRFKAWVESREPLSGKA